MPDLRHTRKKLTRIVTGLAVVDLVAAIIYLSPLVGSEPARNAELRQLWQDLKLRTRQVEPLRGLDKKIVTAQGQITDFYRDRLPAQDSDVPSELGKLASQAGVRIGSVKYNLKDPEPVGLQPLEVEADFSGDYLQLVRFINSLERDRLFFLINSVQLGGEQGGAVKLGMKLETYLRTSSS